MICHQKQLVSKKSLPENNQLATTKRKQIVARWKKIDGKLVCQWFSSEI
ncbi:MAG: hypothetical protein QNJ32_01690 [Xenococcaceae cyanobacterium MO_167.B27]|nr:hypothetical protein [Xenococcaceae cyanobacterium MO_167.B27]